MDAAVAPQLAEHSDAIYLDHALYGRVASLATRVEAGEIELDPASAYWLERCLLAFERAGVNLPDADQARLRALNHRIAELQSEFGRKALAGMNAGAVLVTDEAELDGLSPAEVAGARDRATDRGHESGWLIELDNTSGQRPLDVLKNRELRRRIHLAAVNRGLGGEPDTRPLVVELARLRAERAELLGFANHAAYVAADGCARTGQAVGELLTTLAPAAVANARAEAAEMEQVWQRISPGEPLEAWDWQFVAELLRTERYRLDATLLRPYLELERVLHDGVFAAASGLYGITFTERDDLVGYNDEVRVFEVTDADGTPIGLFCADFYTRGSKQGGAWMNNMVDQNHLLGQPPVVINNSNLVKPPVGEPTLMTWDDVITLFHEFGHALHGLLSDTRYPSQSGTETPRDFVEYPSQVNEMWALDPDILPRYAVHHPRVSRCRPNGWRPCAARRCSSRASRPPSISAPRCSIRSGTGRRWRSCPPTLSRWRSSSGPRWRPSAWTTRWCRRGTARRTSGTPSRAAMTPVTTPTCGRRCWTRTRRPSCAQTVV